MKITKLGIDLAKNVFQLHGVDAQGQVVVRKLDFGHSRGITDRVG